MKNLYLNTGGFSAIFSDFKDVFDGDLTSKNGEYTLAIKSKKAKGTISGISFGKEMSYMHFDLVFYNDTTLSMEAFHSAPVFFAYCERGNLTHSFGVNANKKTIEKNQSGILSNTSAINSVLHFESHKPVQFTLIGVPTIASENEKSDLNSQLRNLFINDNGNFIYVGNENPKIIEKFEEFKNIPQKGIVKNLIKRRILKNIVELEIAQHSYNYLSTFDPIVNLATKQIHELKKLSTINIHDVMQNAVLISRNLVPRIFKEKYHFSFNKSFNQKLAS